MFVTLAISFQEFHVAYVFIKMANSPRPGVFALERSVNNGADWLPWQFFADTPSNCHKYFGEAGYTDSIMSDDSVVCTTQYSQVVPLEGGEVSTTIAFYYKVNNQRMLRTLNSLFFSSSDK